MSTYGGHHGQRQGGGGVRRTDGGTYNPGGGRSGGRHPQSQNSDDRVANLWPDYLKDGYFDSDGHLKHEYVSREKVEPLIKAMTDSKPELTTGQLRRFFGHCRTLETRLRSGTATWAAVRTQFTFLDAAAADAYGKSPSKIPGLFYDFIRRNVDAVKSERDFLQGFLPHFESLVGFGSLHIRKERN